MNIVITGAGSGIGKGIALGLAEKGHHIIVTDMHGEAANTVKDEIIMAGGAATALALDITNSKAVTATMEALPEKPDVLINNAGFQHVSRLETFPQDTWDQLINVLLNGSTRMTRAVLGPMRDKGFGRIINIGSIHSLVASPYKSAYVAAKHGLLGLAKTVALETADTDITINTLCPSYVKTPLVEKQIKQQAAEHNIPESQVISDIMLKPMPKQAFIEMDELTGTVEFLISRAARNITGQAIAIDGGWTIR